MKLTILADNIFYIENAFPEADRFIKEIEEYEYELNIPALQDF